MFSSHDFLSSLSVCLHRTARAPGSHTVSLQALCFAVLVLLMKWLMLAGLCKKRLAWARAVNRQRRRTNRPSLLLSSKRKNLRFARTGTSPFIPGSTPD